MDFLMEKYMGKSKTLLEAEQVLGQLIAEIKKDPLKDYTNHPLSIKFADLLTKQFNFKKTFLTWNRTAEYAPNAFTLFSSDVFLHPMARIKACSDKGYYGDGKHYAYIKASATMIPQLNLTTEEVMALLMHEVGHNFDVSFYMLLSILVEFVMSILESYANFMNPNKNPSLQQMDPNVVNSPEFTVSFLAGAGLSRAVIQGFYMTPIGKDVRAFVVKIWEKLLEAFPILKTAASQWNKFLSWFRRGVETTFSWTVLLAAPLEMCMSPYYHILTVPTRKTEQFADSFAATYGYAIPLATALNKLTSSNLLRDKPGESDIRRIARDLAQVNRDLMYTLMGADHGDNMTRMMSNIQYLKTEVKSSSYPAPMKQELLDQVKRLQSTYRNYLKADGDARFAIAAWCRKMIHDIFDGRSDYVAKTFPDIKTTWETAECYDDCKLAFYESCLRGEISEETRDMLLEEWS